MNESTLRRIKRLAVLTASLFVLFLASCSTAKNPQELTERNLLGWLPPESDIVLQLHVPGNEALASLLLSGVGTGGAELDDALDRAALVAVGIEMKDDDAAFHLATLGSWPRGLIGSALGDEWKKVSRFRWSNPDGLELTLPARDELILSAGKANLMISRAEENAVSKLVSSQTGPTGQPDLEIWFLNPEAFAGDSLVGMLFDAGPGISNMTIALRRNIDGTYALRLGLRPENSSDTSRFALLMRLAVSARFGLSSVEEERALLRNMTLEPEAGEVVMSVPSVSLGVLESLLSEMGIFSGMAQ